MVLKIVVSRRFLVSKLSYFGSMSCTKKSSREVTINTALPHRSHNDSILSLHINNFPSLPKATQFLTILMTYLTFQDS